MIHIDGNKATYSGEKEILIIELINLLSILYSDKGFPFEDQELEHLKTINDLFLKGYSMSQIHEFISKVKKSEENKAWWFEVERTIPEFDIGAFYNDIGIKRLNNGG